MNKYDHKKIENKWQKEWESKKLYQTKSSSKKNNFYALMEFPYPSGDGLHVGHVRGFTAMDVVARKKRMEGKNVLYPIGWDAFGLPTENYAIKTGKDPAVITKTNTDNFRKQFKSLGISFDWSREINTTDPKYYKWTQWLFLRFLEKGLAYKTKMPINWCPKDKIGLANEEVVDGKCERCGTPVEKREKEQWMLAITKYAERLHKDLDDVDYLEKIKIQQRNWIGKSEGAEIEFQILNSKLKIKVFTTRPDTIRGATYLVVSPEHSIVSEIKSQISNFNEVASYIKKAKTKTEIERTSESREKTGVELKGVKAFNPATKKEVPIWTADYVLAHYGTGAIMAVPSDDKRDKEFAEKFDLPVVDEYQKAGFEDFGKKITRYKLRDWVFSRQRYWGEPIPVIHCEKCGAVPVPEKDLPVKLPKVKKYEPTDTGESPLSSVFSWVNTKCPKCKSPAKRETDTMPQWAGSSWYFFRYIDPKNNKNFADNKRLEEWMPVDWYNGGMEHTTLHLLYSRFWNKFLFDLKLVTTSEPYQKRTSHGLILAQNGEKMSKSRGNVVNPDEIVKKYGADTLRIYEMFIGPFDQSVSWSTDGIVGPRRFLEKIWRISKTVSAKNKIDKNLEILIQKTIKKISEDIESMSFNTAISSLMVLSNEMERIDSTNKKQFEIFLKLLAPFAPHISEEVWHNIGNKKSIHIEKWPEFELDKIKDETIKLVVQVNGKVRAVFEEKKGIKEEEALKKALVLPEVKKWTDGKSFKKSFFVPDKLINIIVSE